MADGIASADMGFKSNLCMITSRVEDPQQLLDRIVEPIDDALLERNDRVLRNRNVFRAHLRAAAGNVTEADAVLLLERRDAIGGIERVHLERGRVRQKAWSDELVVQFVIAQDVADILEEKTFDAFAELLDAIDVRLPHPP